jgi:hypothetical protein
MWLAAAAVINIKAASVEGIVPASLLHPERGHAARKDGGQLDF